MLQEPLTYAIKCAKGNDMSTQTDIEKYATKYNNTQQNNDKQILHAKM